MGAGANQLYANDLTLADDEAQDIFYFSSESTGKNIIYDFAAVTMGSINFEEADQICLLDGLTVNSWHDGTNGFLSLSNGGEIELKGCYGKTIVVGNDTISFTGPAF